MIMRYFHTSLMFRFSTFDLNPGLSRPLEVVLCLLHKWQEKNKLDCPQASCLHVISFCNIASSSKLVDLEYKNSVTALATPARQRRSAPPSTTRPKANNTSRRHLKLFRKKTFLVNEDANKAKSEDEQEVANGNDKLRIVQFNQETALSKSIRRKASSKLEGMGPNLDIETRLETCLSLEPPFFLP